MKSRFLISLFATPFFSVGVWMLWSLSATFLDAWNMRNWQPAEATLIAAGYNTSSNDDSDTYEAFDSDTYHRIGRARTGNRVGISRSGDSVGDYQRRTGRWLRSALSGGATIRSSSESANKVLIGEGFNSLAQADAAILMFSKELGLIEKKSARA